VLDYVQYGDLDGRTVIYFHGAPEAPEEASIFDEHAKKHNLNIICYDRFSLNPSLKNENYYQYLANAITDQANGGQVDIIGFSIGCQAAIETTLLLGGTVDNLHLISPAAPLDADDFLDGMAGKIVFNVAMNHPTIFSLLSYWQKVLAKIAPNILFKMLFATATGEDKLLSQTPQFETFIKPILKRCFNRNIKGYIREIKQYVTPWKHSIEQCRTKTHLWHGTLDNWSPVSMAEYLNINLATPSSLKLFDDLSHYTCLYEAAPDICAQLSKVENKLDNKIREPT